MLTTPQSITQVYGENRGRAPSRRPRCHEQVMSVLIDPTLGVRRAASRRTPWPRFARKAARFRWKSFGFALGVWAAGSRGSQSNQRRRECWAPKRPPAKRFGSAVGPVDIASRPNVAGFALAGGGTQFQRPAKKTVAAAAIPTVSRPALM